MSDGGVVGGVSPAQWFKTYGKGNPETLRQLLGAYEEIRGVSLRSAPTAGRLIPPEVSALLVQAFEQAAAEKLAPEVAFRRLLLATQQPKDELALAARASVALFEGKLEQFAGNLAERLVTETDRRFEQIEVDWRRRAELRLSSIDQFQGQLLAEVGERFAGQFTAMLAEQEQALNELNDWRREHLQSLSKTAEDLNMIRETTRTMQHNLSSIGVLLEEAERKDTHLAGVIRSASEDRRLSQELLNQTRGFARQVQAASGQLTGWCLMGLFVGYVLYAVLERTMPGWYDSQKKRLIGMSLLLALCVGYWVRKGLIDGRS